jgi:hypothetical protein
MIFPCLGWLPSEVFGVYSSAKLFKFRTFESGQLGNAASKRLQLEIANNGASRYRLVVIDLPNFLMKFKGSIP